MPRIGFNVPSNWHVWQATAKDLSTPRWSPTQTAPSPRPYSLSPPLLWKLKERLPGGFAQVPSCTKGVHRIHSTGGRPGSRQLCLLQR